MDRYSDGTYLESNPNWHDADAPWKARHIARLLDDADLVPATVCDMGCGSAGVLAELRSLLPKSELVGFDVSPQAVAIAAERHREIDVRLGDVRESGERFEVLLLIDVFEHVEDYLGFLRSLRDCGQRFIFHIPLDMSAQMIVRSRRLLRKRDDVGHLHYFSKDTALASLRTAGYRVDTWRYSAAVLEAANPSLAMRVMRVPRLIGTRLAPDLTANLLGGYSILVLATPEP